MKIGTKKFLDICSERIGYTSLAVYIFLCNTYPNRQITEFSYNKIARICGVSWATAKKSIDHLRKHGAAKIKNGRLQMMSLKKRRSNIDTTQAGMDVYRFHRDTNRRYKKIKELKYLLMEITILNITKRREYIRELMLIANPQGDYSISLKRHKRAKEKMRKLGIAADSIFNEVGVGYESIKSELHCSNYLVRRVTRSRSGKVMRVDRRILRMGKRYLTIWHQLSDSFSREKRTEVMRSVIFEGHTVQGQFFATKKNLYWVQTNLYRPRRGMMEWYYDYRSDIGTAGTPSTPKKAVAFY